MNPNQTPVASQALAEVDSSPVFPERLRFIAPSLPSLEQVVQKFQPAYRTGVITNAACVTSFEREAAAYLNVAHCVAVSSCTSGLILVMRAMGLTGEVILPSFTFFATGHAVRWNGLIPVLADCDQNTWNISAQDIGRKITPRTTAIVAVHMYGNPNEVESLERLATTHNVRLIFDAAHAFGSRYRGRAVGQFGDAEVFSLSPTKLLVAGEGGLVTTSDAVLAKELRLCRNYGDDGTYDPSWVGLNARMSEFNAALGSAGLPMLAEKIARRNEIARIYTEGLNSLPGVRFQHVHAENTHTYKDYSIHITGELFGLSRDALQKALSAENIETKRYFYPPLHKQRHYKQYAHAPLPDTDWVANNILSLPMYESLSDESVKQIIECIHAKREHACHATQNREQRYAHAGAV